MTRLITTIFLFMNLVYSFGQNTFNDKGGITINDSLIYQILNNENDSLLRSNLASQGMKHFILEEQSIIYEKDISIKGFIENVPDTILSPNEKNQLISKLDTNTYKWDCSKLKLCYCLTQKEAVEIFDNKVKDGWVLFRERFGEKASLMSMSKPIFSENMSVYLQISGGLVNWTTGGGILNIYRKNNGIWKEIYNIDIWTN